MTPSTQDLHTLLVRRIIRDFYPRDDALPSERDIADEFRASRTVVRGVLRRLESEGYIEMISPRKRRISPAQPLSVFDAGARLVGVIGVNGLAAGPEERLLIGQRRIWGMFRQLEKAGLSSLNLSLGWPPSIILEQLAAHRICGLIYVNEYHDLSSKMAEFIYRTLVGRLPLATFGDTERLEYRDIAGIERCASDHRAGPRLLLRHLAARGCRRALWYYPYRDRPALVWQAERRAGYEEAARKYGVELVPFSEMLPITNEAGSRENFLRYARAVAVAVAPFVRGPGAVDAVVVDSDVAVPYFQRALHELGRELPVAGYDNYYAATQAFQWESTPPAATIDKNDGQIGGDAAEMILRRLRAADEFAPSFHDFVAPRLVVSGQ